MTPDGSLRPRVPDWYPDPRAEAPLRYWDGEEWTRHIAPLDLRLQLAGAKQQRPWYRKKRITVPVAVAAVVALFAGLGQVPGDEMAHHPDSVASAGG